MELGIIASKLNKIGIISDFKCQIYLYDAGGSPFLWRIHINLIKTQYTYIATLQFDSGPIIS